MTSMDSLDDSIYYDRQGNKITLRQWSSLLNDMEYKRVAMTELASGWLVSTVWLGLDHGFHRADREGAPIIFETMMFCNEPNGMPLFDDYQVRYATEEEALAGHERAVEWAKGMLELRDEEINVDVERG